ncbi:MAG: hypothetical protein R2864_13130 [Syntrophotaleaceae bacterium]
MVVMRGSQAVLAAPWLAAGLADQLLRQAVALVSFRLGILCHGEQIARGMSRT